MEFQVKENNQGSRSLYFGHPFSRETYTNSVQLKTPVSDWETELEGIYQGKHLILKPLVSIESNEVEEELRIIRGTKVMFLGDFSKIQDIESDMGIYHSLCNKAMIKINNPDYLDFELYTERILKDPLKSIFDMTSIQPDLAKKYIDYGIKYEKDKQYSDKLILKPYFVTGDFGAIILTNDFVDYNLNLKIDPEQGVVGCEFWMSENTSHFTHYYKDI